MGLASRNPPPVPQLADGTRVRLKFLQTVNSSQVIAGDKVPLEVAAPVVVDGILAIPEHSPVEAIVTLAQPRGSMARGGSLELKIETIRLADGEPVPVRAVKDVTGQGHQRVATGVAAASFAGPTYPLLFLIHGKNATIAAGTELNAYTVGDVPLDPAKFPSIAGDSKEKTKSQ